MAELRGVLGSPAIFDVIPTTLPPSSAGCGTVRGLDRLRAAAEGAVLAYAEVTGETWKPMKHPCRHPPASAAAAPRSRWPHSRPPDFVFFPTIFYYGRSATARRLVI